MDWGMCFASVQGICKLQLCPAVEIREYHMKDIGLGSEVLYRQGEKQRMVFEDDLTVNTKKQYRQDFSLHTAKVMELIF